MIDFYPRLTNDGSMSLFNKEVDDIYHSSIGAFSESLMKFVYPSGSLEDKTENLSFLDICYGLGYNTKALLTEIYKSNNKKNIIIDVIEIDEWVLALSLIMKDEKTPFFIQKKIIDSFLRESLIEKISLILKEKTFKGFLSFKNIFYIKFKSNRGLKYIRKPHKDLSLHNIYYKYISTQNIQELKSSKKGNFFKINLYISDAREAICQLERTYDYVFHDGFDPKKQSVLWTKGFFEKLYSLMSTNSNLTTYTSSVVVRSAMKEVGYNLAANRYNHKSVGTIAYKGEDKNFSKLNNYEMGLLMTKAGIYYEDNNTMTLKNNDIIEKRIILVNNSNRISSSKYIKESKNAI